VTDNCTTREAASVPGEEFHESIAAAIIKGDLATALALVNELCGLTSAERVARALTIGGLIGSRVRRAAKPLTRSEDADEREKGRKIISELISIDRSIPPSAVYTRRHSRAGAMSF
jgi:hypothetical protein